MNVVTVLEVGAAVIAAMAAVWGLVKQARAEVSRRAQQEIRERAEIAAREFSSGAQSRNDEIALLRSQRDDARRDRDEAKAESRNWQERYMDLRDGRTP
jgi:FtsZ-binding cell division protein ZapB